MSTIKVNIVTHNENLGDFNDWAEIEITQELKNAVNPTLLDEIERLREEVPRAWSCAEACADARRELEREIERLRAEVEFRKARCNELMGRGDE